MKIVINDKSSIGDKLKVNFLGKSIEQELEEAHLDYEKRKNEITTKLYTIWCNNEFPAVYRNWIRQAARFINEKEI